MRRNDLTKKNLFQSWYDQLHSKHVGSETEEQDSEALARIRELHKVQVERMDDDTVKNILEVEMSVKEFVPKKTTDGRLMVFGEDLKGALLDAIVTAQIGTTFCKGMCPLSQVSNHPRRPLCSWEVRPIEEVSKGSAQNDANA